jgi:hypothetical protein
MSLNSEFNFWNNISVINNCWVWLGKRSSNGYGLFYMNGSDKRAHRLAYQFRFGEIPEGKLICHKCDNRLCINPDHLFAGSAKDNMDDMISKGRQFHPKGVLSYHYGKSLSADHKEKLRNINIGRKMTDEAKLKMRIAKLGTKLSNAHKQKISEGIKKFKKSKVHADVVLAELRNVP